jgi:hypothetical protein
MLAVGAAALALLGVPAAANATTYCVTPASSPGCTPQATFGAALTAAETNVGLDRIELGAATYAAPSPGGFYYSPPDTDPVEIVGAGQGQTIITVPPPVSDPAGQTQYFGLLLTQTGGGSTVSDLTVSLPTPTFTSISFPAGHNQQYVGVSDSSESVLTRVTIASPNGIPIWATGLYSALGGSHLINSPIDVGESNGGNPSYGIDEVASNDDDLVVSQSSISADYGIRHSNPSTGILDVNQSAIRARFWGVQAEESAVSVSNSLVDIGSNADARAFDIGYENPGAIGSSSADLDGVTIVGSGDSQFGAFVHATTDNTVPGTDTSTLDMRNSVIDLRGDTPTAIRRVDGVDGSSDVTIDYSAFDPTALAEDDSGALDPGSTTQGLHNLAAVPVGFADFAGGDYRLTAASPLVDAGDPAPPTTPRDLDGNSRALDGDSDCVNAAVRDIGAYELVATAGDCTPPETTVSGKSKLKTKKKRARATFTLGSTEAGSSFQCSLDGAAFASCSTPFRVMLRRGAHTLRVRATDSLGNQDATPASLSFKVVKKKRKKK